MPYLHNVFAPDATTLLLYAQQKAKRPIDNPRHVMDVDGRPTTLREELRLHSRHIRDTLVPQLALQPRLNHADKALLWSIFRKLDSADVTLDVLRYSRIEKALMVIAATGASTWPIDAVGKAEEIIQKWEDELGPLKTLRADLHGPGGRLEGVRKISHGNGKDDDAKSAWSVEVQDTQRSYRYGTLGFQVGDWWLKPAAAYRDGIIDKNHWAITADADGAYAIVVSGNREHDLKPNGDFVYQVADDDPGPWKLTKLFFSDQISHKVVRVLRSYKLHSPLAPKAGLRYDGLYRIVHFIISGDHFKDWDIRFTLRRLTDQPPMSTAQQYPMSDQLDDWRDYQRSKNMDRGDDFAMLRQLAETPMEDPAFGDPRDRQDSGYFSRRSSKATSSRASSLAENTYAISDVRNSPKGDEKSDISFKFVAEGTPSTTSSQAKTPEKGTPVERSDYFFDPQKFLGLKPSSTSSTSRGTIVPIDKTPIQRPNPFAASPNKSPSSAAIPRHGHYVSDTIYEDAISPGTTLEAAAEALRISGATGITRPKVTRTESYMKVTSTRRDSGYDGVEDEDEDDDLTPKAE